MDDDRSNGRAQELIARSLAKLAEVRAIREAEQTERQRLEQQRHELAADGEDAEAMQLRLTRARDQILGRQPAED